MLEIIGRVCRYVEWTPRARYNRNKPNWNKQKLPPLCIQCATQSWDEFKAVFIDENQQDDSGRTHGTGKNGVSRSDYFHAKDGRFPVLPRWVQRTERHIDPQLVHAPQNGWMYRAAGWCPHPSTWTSNSGSNQIKIDENYRQKTDGNSQHFLYQLVRIEFGL